MLMGVGRFQPKGGTGTWKQQMGKKIEQLHGQSDGAREYIALHRVYG